MQKRIRARVAAFALASLLFVVPGTVSAAQVQTAKPSGETAAAAQATTVTPDISTVIDKVTPAVVAVIGKPVNPDNNTTGGRFDLAHGTGVIVQSNGVIMTNAHVVKDMTNLIVVTADGTSYPAKTTHYDEDSDLALVKIEATGLPTVSFSKESVKVGDSVVAIGTPISFALRNSVTLGIVSGMDRSVNSMYQLLQTDAAINPGNSGGPLVNLKGEVIGINTMKYTDIGLDNLGFAIPAQTVQYVLDEFMKNGKVLRPYLGLELEESWEAVVGLPTQKALSVTYVEPGSPAAKAGIKEGDSLLSIGTDSPGTLVALNEVLKKYKPGQQVELTLKSGSNTVKKQITLEEAVTDESWKTTSNSTSIDPDEGKTKIGDSQNKWSMKYPSGLVIFDDYQGENSTIFGDAKGEFSFYIRVDDLDTEGITSASLLRTLTYSDKYGTILEKRYVNDATQPYALVTGKASDGTYTQARAYLKNGKLYTVSMYITDSKVFTNKAKLNVFVELMNSFRTSFDTKDPELKDIGQVRHMKKVKTEYGVSFEIPSGWKSVQWADGLQYADSTYGKLLNVSVLSAETGDTAANWAKDEEKTFLDSYAKDYRESSGIKTTTIAGSPAAEDVLSYTLGADWTAMDTFYVIKDKYKFMFQFSYDQTENPQDMADLAQSVIGTIQFDKNLANSSLGYIQDERRETDPNNTFTYNNRNYKYSVKMPSVWWNDLPTYDKDPKEATFLFNGGSVQIVAETKKFDDAVKDRMNVHKQAHQEDSDYTYKSENTTIYGLTAKKFTIQDNVGDIPAQTTEYVFTKGSFTYTLILSLNDAVRTDANVRRMEQVLGSFTFLK